MSDQRVTIVKNILREVERVSKLTELPHDAVCELRFSLVKNTIHLHMQFDPGHASGIDLEDYIRIQSLAMSRFVIQLEPNSYTHAVLLDYLIKECPKVVKAKLRYRCTTYSEQLTQANKIISSLA